MVLAVILVLAIIMVLAVIMVLAIIMVLAVISCVLLNGHTERTLITHIAQFDDMTKLSINK